MLDDGAIARERAGVLKRAHPPILAFEPRLVVEGIDLARPALHEDEGDALRLGRMMRRAEPRKGPVAGGEHVRQREIAEAAGERLEGGTAGDCRVHGFTRLRGVTVESHFTRNTHKSSAL